MFQDHKARGVVAVDDVWRTDNRGVTPAPVDIGQLSELIQSLQGYTAAILTYPYLTMSCRNCEIFANIFTLDKVGIIFLQFFHDSW